MSLRSPFRGATADDTVRAILDLIRSSGTVSRTELIDRSGLTGASITRIVRQLLDDGLIAETGLGHSTGGKRRTLLQLNPTARTALGISLDYDQITYVAIDMAGRIISQRSAKGTGMRRPAEVVRRVAEEINELLASGGFDSDVVGIGVAIAGRQGSHEHDWFTANATDWEHFALQESLGAATGRHVVVNNDSACAAIGEYWVGRLSSTEDLATVYMTDGFGLGMVLKGHTYLGASSNAGEIGHVTVDPSGPECICGRRGCLHAMGGMQAIVNLAHADKEFANSHRLRGTPGTVRNDFAKIAQAAVSGDQRADALIRRSADALGSALVSITNVLDLNRIILSGPGFSQIGQIYAETVAENLAHGVWAAPKNSVRVGLSTIGHDVAALGAASLVLHSEFTQKSRPGSPDRNVYNKP